MSRLLALAVLVLASATVHAQAPPGTADGTVVARDTLRFTPAERADLARYVAARLSPDVDARAAFDAVVVERITYQSRGLRVTAYLAAPRVGADLPAVIYNRGGTGDFGALDTVAVAAVLVPLAARGYVVVGSQYRGADGGEGRDEYGGADVADVLSLIPLLDAHPRVDGSRIGMVGASRGGLMTYRALAETSRVRAAVIIAGLSDARALVAARPEMESEVLAQLVPDWATVRETALDARSPALWANRLPAATPLLLLHGTADDRVGAETTLRMGQALLAAERPVRLVLYDGGDHGLSQHRREAFAETAAWLDRHVRGPVPAAPIPDAP